MARGDLVASIVVGLMPISANSAYPTGKFSGRRFLSAMGKYYKGHLQTALEWSWKDHDPGEWPKKLLLRITLWMPSEVLHTKKDGSPKAFDTSNYFKLTEDTVSEFIDIDDRHNWEIRSEKLVRFDEFKTINESPFNVLGPSPVPLVQIEVFEYTEAREAPVEIDYIPVVDCPYCAGTGKHKPPPKYDGKPMKCPVCSGEGQVISPRHPFNPGKLSTRKVLATMKSSAGAKRCCRKKDFHVAKTGPWKNPNGEMVMILQCLDCGHFEEVDW
jgi:hypothetical protein